MCLCVLCVDAAGQHTSSTVNRWEIRRVENRISPQSVLFLFLAVCYMKWNDSISITLLDAVGWMMGPFYLFRLLRALFCAPYARTQLAATIWRGVDQLMTIGRRRSRQGRRRQGSLTYSIVSPSCARKSRKYQSTHFDAVCLFVLAVYE